MVLGLAGWPEELQPEVFCFAILGVFVGAFWIQNGAQLQHFWESLFTSYRFLEPGTVGNHSETIHRAQAQGVCQSHEEALHEAAVLGRRMDL